MTTLDARIENPELRAKVMPVEEAVKLVKSGDTLAVSGFTKAGEPKTFLPALAKHFAATNPEALQIALETKGESLHKGIRHLIEDVEQGRVSMTDESAFEVGFGDMLVGQAVSGQGIPAGSFVTASAAKEKIAPPELMEKVEPKYPADARAEKIQGTIKVEAKVSEEGKVEEAIASESPDPRLAQAAVDAVKQWKFKPARKADGKAVKVKTTITVNFRLK